ncbi:SIS domain-containing protein [Larsenimonas salina]|uniref:SIS domain-containing protein n=1 Tax=Larsenimonas salina TaxID=1295565 RepID=UPI00207483DA|nr:SIS domain-containing protein [Larsenimonas salina]MCM5705505.1 SIS domain-containing protein [Larsenimonas salina]
MSLMKEEALSCAAILRQQTPALEAPLARLSATLRSHPPAMMLTVARGSSDHAASYAGYLAMKHLGRPMASIPPSLSTHHQVPWHVDGALSLAISQSGQSPDLVDLQRALDQGGARTLALTNAPDSPLGHASAHELILHAGTEQSVAATKSYLATLAACAQLIGLWAEDTALLDALTALPETLDHACTKPWTSAVERLEHADRMLVIGRGSGLAIAQEAALKFKETCAIQAEAFSGAEVRHGPMALIGPGYPVLVFAPPGPEQQSLLELADWLEGVGADVLLAADPRIARRTLTLSDAAHDDLQPLSAIQSFYLMVEQLARARGLDPDAPPHLSKVTRTR